MNICKCKNGYSGTGIYYKNAETSTDGSGIKILSHSTDFFLIDEEIREVDDEESQVTPNSSKKPKGKQTKLSDFFTPKVEENKAFGYKEKEGRVMTVELEDLIIVGVYTPNSGASLERLSYRTLNWDKSFIQHLQKLSEKNANSKPKPIIVCGDLNVAYLEIDIHDPKNNKKSAGFTDAERDSFKKLFLGCDPEKKNSDEKTETPKDDECDEVQPKAPKLKFMDTFRMLHKDEAGHYTYYGYRGGMRTKNKGWRLDYFLCTDDMKDQIVDSIIGKEYYGSDHVPIMLILKKNSDKPSN